ncbi:hypothetical protein [uncultured Draconibacterium sp.]|uniref:hypothetical protein n=1 Tax=uncultured Draconibacterium sp. TaxID=1573823 RepID=UPI0026008305|nr:hypothetical protein [uncultured Draconibacterium sp.]
MKQLTLLRTLFEGKGEVKSFNFKQLNKTTKAYIYEVSHPDVKKVHYEVFLRKTYKPDNREIYPSAKSFGKWAWTFRS